MCKYFRFQVISLYIFTLITLSVSGRNEFSTTYRNLSIENDRLCSPMVKRKIDLGKYGEAGLIVTIDRTKNHNMDWTYNFNCKFKVDSESDYGAFAVIQNINFRRNHTTNECIDYIQFRTKSGVSGPQICGKTNIILEETSINSDLSIFDAKGKIDTIIFISKERLYTGQKTELLIVYTSSWRCDESMIICPNDNYRFRHSRCILNVFANDGLVNCPHPGCVDESGCDQLAQNQKWIYYNDEEFGIHDPIGDLGSSTSTTVALSALASLVLSFLVFIACIWLCKKTGKLCWSVRCMDSPNNQRTQSSRVIEMQNRPEQVSTTAVPVPSAPEPDKDLPPPYDTLFPPK